jgi:hypothetical protein
VRLAAPENKQVEMVRLSLENSTSLKAQSSRFLLDKLEQRTQQDLVAEAVGLLWFLIQIHL